MAEIHRRGDVAKCPACGWRLLLDTAAEPPADIYADADGPAINSAKPLMLAHHSLRCYVAER